MARSRATTCAQTCLVDKPPNQYPLRTHRVSFATDGFNRGVIVAIREIELPSVSGQGQKVTPDHTQAHAIARKIETLIRARFSELSQAAIAEALDVAPSSVNRYLSGQSCIPLERLGPLFVALGLRVLPAEELAAICMFAGRHLSGEGA
jgi:helix-turn-helix protein